MTQAYTLDELEQLLLDLQAADDIPQHRWWRPHFSWQGKLWGETQIMRLYMLLTETAIWSTHHLDTNNLSDSLRTSSLMPNPLNKSRFHAAYDAQKRRSWAISGRKIEPIEIEYDLILSGRLLVYFPDATLSDGAAYFETDGFLDNDNMPPWETWLDYFEEPYDRIEHMGSRHNYLISWVPAPLIKKVSRGIEVNPERCIEWLDDSNVAFRIVWEESLKLLRPRA